MKKSKASPLVDPAVLYLAGFVALVGLGAVAGSFLFGQPSAASRTQRQFPNEAEVKSSIHEGLTEDDIIYRYGIPTDRGPLEDGLEALNYVAPASQVPPDDPTFYAGFTVICRDGKVEDVNIIRGSDLRGRK